MEKKSSKKIDILIRDICAVFVLVGLVSIPVKRAVRFINAHQNSLLHELDGTLLAQLRQTRDQFSIVERLAKVQKTISLEEIQELYLQLDQLEEHYKTNSHGYVLLGPIGSAGIVLKERKVKNLLLQLNNQFRSLLLRMLPNEDERKQYDIEQKTLSESLASNTQLLRSLAR